MKNKQKLNSLALAGSVLILFLILFSSTASAADRDQVISNAVHKIAGMKSDVQDLVDSNTLSKNHGKMLESDLQNAKDDLNNGNIREAIINLERFKSTIKTIINNSTKLSPQHVDDLQNMINTANNIISSLKKM